MPLVQTRGAASAQGFGEFAQATAANYIEEVFSTYLYTGTGAALTITNNIDLSTQGGLVWIKGRSGTFAHRLTDTARGATKELVSNAVTIEATVANGLTAFNSTGFVLGSDIYFNNNTSTYVSWTFREQPKFFDVVKYTGNSVSGRAIPHNLGSAPGCVIIKAIDQPENWVVWHRSGSQDNTHGAYLNTSATYSNKAIDLWGSSPGTPDMNATTFSVGGTVINNGGGSPYVAYIFAHDAGGFGLAGTDNVISCGSYTGNGSATGPVVTLGYEPQWLMIKNSSSTGNWQILDNMRGMPVGSADATLQANLSNAETSVDYASPTATGFQITSSDTEVNTSAATYIYIACRRGPMKVPTLSTSVFSPIFPSASSGTQMTTGFPVDLQLLVYAPGGYGPYVMDRLRGVITTKTDASSPFLKTNSTAMEVSNDFITRYWNNTGFEGSSFFGGTSTVFWNFRRAPSFFDEVCYTGTDTGTRILDHNLTVTPELVIVKKRSATLDWAVQASTFTTDNILFLNTTAALTSTPSYLSYPEQNTSTTFKVRYNLNVISETYVAYLFATCPGVSKVGSYTGTATTLQIDCGFTAGARFVLIKRTDSTGDWYVWDSARGIVSGNDPYLLLNTTAAEVTSTDYVDTYSAGFEISSTAPAAINASAGSFIFLAIA